MAFYEGRARKRNSLLSPKALLPTPFRVPVKGEAESLASHRLQ